MKPNLLILSDIHGSTEIDWLDYYQERLSSHFKIEFLNTVELSGMNASQLKTEEIHQQFIDGGIDDAVAALLQLNLKCNYVLAFSVGGTIAWKAVLKGLPMIKVFAVSSTRLRKEYQRPKSEVELYFGEKDMHRPMDEWFEQMEIFPTILRGKEHDMYREEGVAEKVSEDLLREINADI